jgi:hypothetical protein
MLGAPLIGHQIIQMGQTTQECLLAPIWMMKTFHHKEFPINGVMGLVQQSAGHWHLRVGEHRRPARFFVLKPVLYALAMSCPSRGGDKIGKVASPLAQRKHA